ncbi:MAG: ketosteroid isomerase-related protein [Hyphomicrobiales bacterium]
MTAAATTKLIARYYAAFNAQDVAGMLDCLGPGFVHDVSQGARRRGKARFAEFLAHMNRSYRERLSNIVIMTDATGAHAAAEFDLAGTYLVTDPGLPKAKGQSYRLRVGTFFEVKKGRIARVSTHYNLGDWKRQVLGR